MNANGRRRVVITGLGAVTPLGNDVRSSWEDLVAGRSAAGPITAFDTTGFAVTFACEVKDFEPAQWTAPKQARRMDRFAQMLVAAAHQARADAGLEIEQECHRVGVSAATAMGGLKSFEDACETLIKRGPARVNPFSLTAIIPNMSAARLSIELGTKGPLSSPCTACAASTMAIGNALDAIRLDRADVMLAGGSEAPITRVGMAGFSALRALSRRNDDPEHASRPFEADRDGFVMGEAGAVLVLEELGHATRRGARIYAELVGYGASSDAQHLTEPDPTGESQARAMRMALADADLSPDQIDYINAHGTSTPLGDASETRVIKRALGAHIARKVPISSTKGATGHSLGASGAVEAIFCTLAIHEGVLPPTINYETPDPECDLDYVPNEARTADVGVAVSNSSGFGGHNASIVLRRFAG
jgi:beta-ketoacyl-acyl-carrier-protein synthase II